MPTIQAKTVNFALSCSACEMIENNVGDRWNDLLGDIIGGVNYNYPMIPLAPTFHFYGPVKRSITIAGHETSISLEPLFWAALERAAGELQLPLSALVAEVDALRIMQPSPPNLASALRTWLFARVARDNDESQSH